MDSIGRVCQCRRDERSNARTDRFHDATGLVETEKETLSRTPCSIGATRAGVNRGLFYFHVRIRMLSVFSERFRKSFRSFR